MKINLGCGNDMRSGYINIDRISYNGVVLGTYRQGDIASLDWLAENDSVEEIVALNCLEYLCINQIKSALVNWIQKLKSGGAIKILSSDCYAVAQAFHQGQLSLPEYLQIIFGTQENDDKKLSAIDAHSLLTLLKENGMTISLKRYEGISIYVEATK